MSKRVKPVILIGVVFLCLALLSGTATALDGDGTPSNPYIIKSTDDLIGIDFTTSNNLSASYVLESDIDLDGEIWTPIGNYSSPFTGTFSGSYVNGEYEYTISNLNLDTGVTWSEYIGFFGYTKNATISNLSLNNFEIGGSHQYVGSLIGYADNTIVNYCCVTDSSISGNNDVGGLVGYMSIYDDLVTETPVNGDNNKTVILSDKLYLDHCAIANITVMASDSNAGGLVGYANGYSASTYHYDSVNETDINFYYYLPLKISECTVTNTEVIAPFQAGGLVGSSDITNIDKCTVSGGMMRGIAGVGGLAGMFSSGNITNSNIILYEDNPIFIDGSAFPDGSLSIGFGGLVGMAMDMNGRAGINIDNCHVIGSVYVDIGADAGASDPKLVGGAGGLIGVIFSLPNNMPDFEGLPPIGGNGDIFNVRTDLDPEELAAYLGTITNASVSKSSFMGTVFVQNTDDVAQNYFLLGIGGLLGAGGFSEITECEAEGLIIVDTTNSMATVGVGGFSGALAANLIDDCFADMEIIVGTDSVSSPTVFVGGIGGFGGLIAANIIENSYATGTINVETTHNNGVSSADLKPLIFGLLDSFGFNIETVITDLESQIENLEDELEDDPGNETLTADLQSAREQLLIYTTLYEIDLGTVPANSGAVGGFSGLSLIAVIENCTAESDIHVIGDAVIGTGGFTGFSLIEILNKTNATGNVYVEGNDCSGVGGLVGFSVIELIGNSSATGDVELNGTLSCLDGGFADGDVSGLGGVGGLVGVSVWLCPLDAVFDILSEMEFLNEKIVIDSLIENSNAQNKNVSGVFNVGRIVGLSVYFLHDQTDLLVTNLIYGGEVSYEHTHTAVISNNVYASGSMKNLYASNLVQTIPGAVPKYPGFTEMTDENLNGSLFSTINGKNASTNTGSGGSGTGSATIVDRITETVPENSGGASGSSDGEIEEAMADEDINEENKASKSMWWILILLAAIVLIAVGYWYYRKNNTI